MALGRVLDGVGYEVLQQTPQEPPVGADREPARHEFQLELFLAGERRELDLELAE